MAHGTQNLAALGFDEFACLLFQRVAESIVGSEEVPGIAALLHKRAAGADCKRMGVIGPMEAIRRALLAGQFRCGRTCVDGDLLLVLGQGLYGEADR